MSDFSDSDRDTDTKNADSTAGVVAHMAGQDTSAGSSVAGAAPSGGPIDGAARPDEPTANDLNDAGESVADDAVPPQQD